MKVKVQFFLILFFTLFCNRSNAQTSLELELLQLNLIAVLNKPIDTVLSKLPSPNDTTMTISSGSSYFQGASLIITYPGNHYSVFLYPHDIQYITVLNSDKLPAAQAWPFHLLRKEKLWSIVIYKDGDIIKEMQYTPGTEYKK